MIAIDFKQKKKTIDPAPVQRKAAEAVEKKTEIQQAQTPQARNKSSFDYLTVIEQQGAEIMALIEEAVIKEIEGIKSREVDTSNKIQAMRAVLSEVAQIDLTEVKQLKETSQRHIAALGTIKGLIMQLDEEVQKAGIGDTEIAEIIKEATKKVKLEIGDTEPRNIAQTQNSVVNKALITATIINTIALSALAAYILF